MSFSLTYVATKRKGEKAVKKSLLPFVVSIIGAFILTFTYLGPFLGKYPDFGKDPLLDYPLAFATGLGLEATTENLWSKIKDISKK